MVRGWFGAGLLEALSASGIVNAQDAMVAAAAGESFAVAEVRAVRDVGLFMCPGSAVCAVACRLRLRESLQD
jgi:hypothetical protein